MENELIELATPFPDKYIRQKPGKANASYVNHGVIRQRLLDVVGFYDWSIDREIYQKDGTLTGCIGTLTVRVGGKDIKVQGSGDVEHNQGTNGANLKHAESDAFKRAAMNLGLGLHLWCGDEYFLYNKNQDVTTQEVTEPSS
tara:strand:+ start:1668 stop:2093 length:426 start_codon:yes stop_codon:yes gene_type:complete